MQLFVINGSSCSGKSTLVKGVFEQRGGLFHLSSDRLKWSFSDYKAKKSEYKEAIDQIILAVANTAFSLGYTVFSDSSLWRDQREKIISKAREYGYDIIEINLEIDYELLETRFKERLESARAEGFVRMANTSLDRFKELYEIYNNEKTPDAIVYRSDQLTSEEIIAAVLKMID